MWRQETLTQLLRWWSPFEVYSKYFNVSASICLKPADVMKRRESPAESWNRQTIWSTSNDPLPSVSATFEDVNFPLWWVFGENVPRPQTFVAAKQLQMSLIWYKSILEFIQMSEGWTINSVVFPARFCDCQQVRRVEAAIKSSWVALEKQELHQLTSWRSCLPTEAETKYTHFLWRPRKRFHIVTSQRNHSN